MIFYDMEVLKHYFCMVYFDTKTKKFGCVNNDTTELKTVYEAYKNDIWVGYNSRSYDRWIVRAILMGQDPYVLSQAMITENKKPWDVYPGIQYEYSFQNFDAMTGFFSLKQLEAFMGHSIEESTIPFDLDRPLTPEEQAELIRYCRHDVKELVYVFMERKHEYESQKALIEEFKLPGIHFSKTKAQLSALILGAEQPKRPRNDEFDLVIPDTLRLDKYQYIADWYKDPLNMSYEKFLDTEIAGVQHKLAWGGIHGAIPNFSGNGKFIMMDVASMYPAIMIEYGFLSRNVKNPAKFKQIRDERIILKAAKDPRQQPYKIVLNSTYGASKDKYNGLYDPRQANNVCITGQLLLVDLIEKVEPYCKLIQSNTDGILVQVDNDENEKAVYAAAAEWSKRTRLELEFDNYMRVIQKDVNNYIIIADNGNYKSKGAYVKKLSKLDNDLPIVNRGVTNYLIHGLDPWVTVNQTDDLIDFQKVVKITNKYLCAVHGETDLHGKVFRVFADKRQSAGGFFKRKSAEKKDKVANTPTRCFIDNGDITGKKCPDYLDRDYYVQLIHERIRQFIGR